jgi:hypothetical protein
MGGASRLDRRCNKPVLSAGSFAIGTNSLHENSNKSDIALPCCQHTHDFPTNCLPPRWLLLPASSLSAMIAALGQLTLVHKQFLERGQEVSHDLVLMSRRNFS